MFDTPVHSVKECEHALLGKLICAGTYSTPEKSMALLDEIMSFVDSEMFYDSRNATVFGSMKQLSEKSVNGTDFAALLTHIKENDLLENVGGVTYLEELVSSYYSTANIVFYAEKVREYAKRRKAVEVSHELTRRLNDGENVSEVLSTARDSIDSVNADSRSMTAIPLSEAIMESFKDEENAGEVIPTGFSCIDNLLTGFRQGQMIILGGRPSQGKTSLAVNIMMNMARNGVKMVFFSLEMAKQEIVHRMIAVEGGCNLSKEVMATNRPSWTQKKIAETANAIFSYPIFIDDTPGRNITEIETIARNLVKNEGIQVVFVDHLGWIETGEKKQTEYEQVTKVARKLKNMARTLNVPVVVLSQLNRSVENRREIRPRMSDLRSSGAIEQDADVVMFIHREEYYKTKEQAEEMKVAGKADVIIAKVRNGATGDVRLNWDGESTRFFEEPDFEEFTGEF